MQPTQLVFRAREEISTGGHKNVNISQEMHASMEARAPTLQQHLLEANPPFRSHMPYE